MGDRCYLSIGFSEKDCDKIVELATECDHGGEPDNVGPFELEYHEINYGGQDLINFLVNHPDCPPFMYHHTAGIEHGAYVGVCMKQQHVEVRGDDQAHVVCIYTEDGPRPEDLINIEAFFTLKREYDLYLALRK